VAIARFSWGPCVSSGGPLDPLPRQAFAGTSFALHARCEREKAADRKLTMLAEAGINEAAISGEEEDDETRKR